MGADRRTGRLVERTVLITGGGQGIGKGIALAMADEGGAVAVLDIDGDKARAVATACEARGAPAMSIVGDVTDPDDCSEAVTAIVDRFGGVDVLVTGAVPHVSVKPFADTTADEIEVMWRVGYLGVVNAMRAVLPHLRASRGCVINFGSGAGIHGSAGYAAYAPVKEAVRAITRVTAREWGQHGIRVNAICPFARSEQFDEWAEMYPEQVAAAGASTILGRVGECEADIGRAAVFLASDDAAFVTGHTLMVDGGQTLS